MRRCHESGECCHVHTIFARFVIHASHSAVYTAHTHKLHVPMHRSFGSAQLLRTGIRVTGHRSQGPRWHPEVARVSSHAIVHDTSAPPVDDTAGLTVLTYVSWPGDACSHHIMPVMRRHVIIYEILLPFSSVMIYVRHLLCVYVPLYL